MDLPTHESSTTAELNSLEMPPAKRQKTDTAATTDDHKVPTCVSSSNTDAGVNKVDAPVDSGAAESGSNNARTERACALNVGGSQSNETAKVDASITDGMLFRNLIARSEDVVPHVGGTALSWMRPTIGKTLVDHVVHRGTVLHWLDFDLAKSTLSWSQTIDGHIRTYSVPVNMELKLDQLRVTSSIPERVPDDKPIPKPPAPPSRQVGLLQYDDDEEEWATPADVQHHYAGFGGILE